MTEIVIPIGEDTITLTDYGDGIVGPGIQGHEVSNEALKKLPHYSLFRDDDVMLCTYGKCGIIVFFLFFSLNYMWLLFEHHRQTFSVPS